jgi:hypothetical protein
VSYQTNQSDNLGSFCHHYNFIYLYQMIYHSDTQVVIMVDKALSESSKFPDATEIIRNYCHIILSSWWQKSQLWQHVSSCQILPGGSCPQYADCSEYKITTYPSTIIQNI